MTREADNQQGREDVAPRAAALGAFLQTHAVLPPRGPRLTRLTAVAEGARYRLPSGEVVLARTLFTFDAAERPVAVGWRFHSTTPVPSYYELQAGTGALWRICPAATAPTPGASAPVPTPAPTDFTLVDLRPVPADAG
jgi:hypothetical protein